MFLPKLSDIFSPEGGCSEGLDAFNFFLNSVRFRIAGSKVLVSFQTPYCMKVVLFAMYNINGSGSSISCKKNNRSLPKVRFCTS